jgi:hypothetical protein
MERYHLNERHLPAAIKPHFDRLPTTDNENPALQSG